MDCGRDDRRVRAVANVVRAPLNEFIGQPPLTYITWCKPMTAARMLRDLESRWPPAGCGTRRGSRSPTRSRGSGASRRGTTGKPSGAGAACQGGYADLAAWTSEKISNRVSRAVRLKSRRTNGGGAAKRRTAPARRARRSAATRSPRIVESMKSSALRSRMIVTDVASSRVALNRSRRRSALDMSNSPISDTTMHGRPSGAPDSTTSRPLAAGGCGIDTAPPWPQSAIPRMTAQPNHRCHAAAIR